MKYAISDTHGRKDLLDAMLEKIGFGPSDELYFIGDAADRGPDGMEILLWAMAEPNVKFILGNHEEMLLRSCRGPGGYGYRECWMDNGGEPTRADFDGLSKETQEMVLDWIQDLPEWLDVDAGGKAYRLVHASWSQNREDRIWMRPKPFMPARGTDRRVIVGHTPVLLFYPDPGRYLQKCGDHMRIYQCTGFIGIDCGCGLPDLYKKRALACLRLDDMAEFYVRL